MYTRPYGDAERPFRVPPHYGGSAFQNHAQEAPAPPPPPIKESPLEGILQPLQSLLGRPTMAPGTPSFDEVLLLGLIFLLSGSERGKEIIPILALLLFCGA